ncbi:transcriptional regulator domain-containing protein [Chelativorans sp. M5D2P16]|uniref:transcriptional regulator domain-containing protein n=1 Tax=Chelativorans sp. M5D2P16 TaxID=3095678 RepID=UPI002ACA874E|nr:DUF6499 domain-containing protein [Chelativorans sp. M5D2P16]MDZ5696742.1 DUF6499 domain-containing protein [Chelativorans sp. M5D2P16]
MMATCSDADRPDWRNEKAYAYTARLTRREWAWEFLRRNPEFRRQLAIAVRQATCSKGRAALQAIRSTVDLSRWGILFRRFRKL